MWQICWKTYDGHWYRRDIMTYIEVPSDDGVYIPVSDFNISHFFAIAAPIILQVEFTCSDSCQILTDFKTYWFFVHFENRCYLGTLLTQARRQCPNLYWGKMELENFASPIMFDILGQCCSSYCFHYLKNPLMVRLKDRIKKQHFCKTEGWRKIMVEVLPTLCYQ